MKIRTITLGLTDLPTAETLRWAGAKLRSVADLFISRGFFVQSQRIALGKWANGLGRLDRGDRTLALRELDSLLAANGIDFCSIGIIKESSDIEEVAEVLSGAARLNACVDGGGIDMGINEEALPAAARAVLQISRATKDGVGNFCFGTGFSLGANIPYFPGSYHEGPRPGFSIGLESSDLLVHSFARSRNITDGGRVLYEVLSDVCKEIQDGAEQWSSSERIDFLGIDTSIAPSVHPEESIVNAFNLLGIEFGKAGTLSLCSLVTNVLKRIPVKKVGYCGIMLPVLEDFGLAQASSSNQLRIVDLLACSSVCGVGVDMVPLAGEVETRKIELLMRDVGSMSMRLNKPLTVRVLPVPGKRFGERTAFASMYICNGAVMEI